MMHVSICLLGALLCTLLPLPLQAANPAPTGWKTIQQDGVSWLQTPDGSLFFSKGVNIVTGAKETAKSRLGQAYCWANHYSSLDAWRRSVTQQLRGWGFNTRGGWSDPSPELDLALTVDLELGRNAQFHWFDPFDPQMEKHVIETAVSLTEPYRNDPRLIGYFSDNEVGWWNTPLFEWYLQLGWGNHTKRVLWQLLLDHYAGNWDRFLADWAPQGKVTCFEDLKAEGTRLKLRPGGEGIRMVDRFMYTLTSRYYALMFRALRQVHPEALVLGDRLPLYYHQDAILAIKDNVDVISTNYNVDVPDGWVAPYYFEGLRRLTQKPVLVTEFFFAAMENRSGNRNETARNIHAKPRHLMTVETQDERALGAALAYRNFASFPNVLGVHWFQYADEPLGGREDGEDYNMGLVDTSNRPYEQVTETFRRLNLEMEPLHQQSLQHASRGYLEKVGTEADAVSPSGDAPIPLYRATRPLNVQDQSLVDWDKAETRLQRLKAPEPYVPFGDVHLAWTPQGLYLASIANTYVNPGFLEYRGDFPLSEAFQVHLLVEAAGALHHYAAYLTPRHNPSFPDGFEVIPQLYQCLNGSPAERLPVEGRIQKIDKSLPHMAIEAFFPARSLGLEELRPNMPMKINVVITNYYRELTMVWTGEPSLKSAADPHSLKAVVLKDSTRPPATSLYQLPGGRDPAASRTGDSHTTPGESQRAPGESR